MRVQAAIFYSQHAAVVTNVATMLGVPDKSLAASCYTQGYDRIARFDVFHPTGIFAEKLFSGAQSVMRAIWFCCK